jgi:EAL domain-containing protein (putative c-di-GMP-specific phosphodiesterase class I)
MQMGSEPGWVLADFDPLVLTQRVADQALVFVPGADGVLVGLSDGEVITYVCGSGHLKGVLGTRTRVEGSISGLAITTGEVLVCTDTEADARVDREACRRLGTRSTVCLPLSRGEDLFGVLAACATRPSAFGDDDVARLREMAGVISALMRIADDCERVRDLVAGLQAGDGSSELVTSSNASRFFLNVVSPQATARFDARARVEAVLEHPESLSMLFQPVIDLRSGTMPMAEALARFSSGPVTRSPDEWFNDAHTVGLGTDLEMLAVNKALRALSVLPAAVAVAVNVGPSVVVAPPFVKAMTRVLEPRRVVIELTEGKAVADEGEVASVLMTLRERGLRVAVDDAGSGYAGLARILRLAPDFIKLDRELVTGIDADPVRRAMATALVTFAGDSGAEIVAEGIETAEEAEVIRRLGIRFGQGHYLAKAAPVFGALAELAV